MRRAALLFASALYIVTACGRVGPTPGDLASASGTATPTPTPACATRPPSHRSGASAAYDQGRRVTVVFGGDAGGSRTLDETWLFDGLCWQQAHPALSPAPRIGAGMAHDPVLGRTLLIGGRSQPPVQPDFPEDAWTWDGTAWTRLAGAPKLDFPLASYDEARLVVVVFGWGPAGVPETWTWDGTTWVRRMSPKSPSVVSQSAMCFDRSTHKLLLYGGVSTSIGGGVSSETWLWDGSIWTQWQPAHVPGPRFNHLLSCGAKTVLFGGLVDLSPPARIASDTWLWDGADWQQVATTHTPSDCCGAAVYDGNRQMILETGHDGIPIWSWNGSDWQ
jgi:hypothetical protein